MPRVVRNFWISADVDGLASPLRGGPARKDGGFTLSIKQRDEGCVTEALTVSGHACDDGTLVVCVEDAKTRKCVFQVVTKR